MITPERAVLRPRRLIEPPSIKRLIQRYSGGKTVEEVRKEQKEIQKKWQTQ